MKNKNASLFSPERSFTWIILGILSKTILYAYILHLGNVNYPRTGADGNSVPYLNTIETSTFLGPAESMINGGDYQSNPDDKWTRVTRMPGYAAPYFLFRLFCSPFVAKGLLVLAQVLLGGISIYYLALVSQMLTNKVSVFYITFILYSISTYVCVLDRYVGPESLGVSILIFSIYFAMRYKQTGRNSFIAISGLLLTWTILLRVIAITILPFFLLYFLWDNGKRMSIRIRSILDRFKKMRIPLSLFLIWLIGFELWWIPRNYRDLKMIIPFQYNRWVEGTGEPAEDLEYHMYNWIKTVGGDMIFYRPNTLAAWMCNTPFAGKDWLPPSRIFTSTFNLDSVRSMRRDFLLIQTEIIDHNTHHHTLSQNNAARILNARFDAYTINYKQEKPFYYFVLNRIVLLKEFLVNSGSIYLPFKKLDSMKADYFGIFFKISQSILYWIVLLFGLAGGFLAWRARNPENMFILSATLVLICVFPFILLFIDIRFFNPAYALLTILASISIQKCLSLIWNYRTKHA